MKKLIILSLTVLLGILVSCTDESIYYSENNKIDTKSGINLSTFQVESQFCKALVNVMAQKEEARTVIKNEALKRINYDNDVLYYFIKDEKFNDGTTFHENMLNHMDSIVMQTIIENMPTLTILVPELPENSFSPETWDVTTQIPMVAMDAFQNNEILYFDSNGQEIQKAKNIIPKFPVIGIKINERIITGETNSFANSYSGVSFSFIDDIFDNSNNSNNSKIEKSNSNYPVPTIPTYLEKAYQAFDLYGTSTTGWQRDYVYYDLTPTSTRGELKINYEETLISFKMKGRTGEEALRLIEDQDEDAGPDRNWTWNPRSQPHPNNGWLEGAFEFVIKFNTGLSIESERQKHFGAKGSDLFDIKYKDIGGGWSGYSHVEIKKYILPDGGLPLFIWDLQNHTSYIIIKIEEKDADGTETSTNRTTIKYASNFEINPQKGIFEKVGLKFGATGEKEKEVSWSRTTTLGNDLLGSCDMRIEQPFLLSRTNMAEWFTDRRTGEEYQTEWIPDGQVYTGGNFDAEIIPTKRY